MIDIQIHRISNSPFWGGLIFQAFYAGFNKKCCSINIHYLILPLILHGNTRGFLKNTTSRVDLSSLIEKEKLSLIDLQERIWSHNQLTKQTLVLLHNQHKIVLKEDVEILVTISYNNIESASKEYLKAATNLGQLINQFSEVEIYKLFKVIP